MRFPSLCSLRQVAATSEAALPTAYIKSWRELQTCHPVEVVGYWCTPGLLYEVFYSTVRHKGHGSSFMRTPELTFSQRCWDVR